MYTYTFMCMSTHMHAHTCTFTHHMCKHTSHVHNTSMCMNTYVHVLTCMCTHREMHSTHVHICMLVYEHIHECKYMCVSTAHMHMCIYKHTHTRGQGEEEIERRKGRKGWEERRWDREEKGNGTRKGEESEAVLCFTENELGKSVTLSSEPVTGWLSVSPQIFPLLGSCSCLQMGVKSALLTTP